MKIVLAGGGTAGHIEPALATADALRRLDPGGTVSLVGTARGLETRLVPDRGYELDLISPVPLPRRPSVDLLRLPGRIRRAIREAAEVIRVRQADAVVGFGGYVALPVYLAARKAAVPIVVHEANAKPGLANRIGARYSRHVGVAVEHAALPHATVLGIPLRRTISTLDRAATRAEGRNAFGLDPAKRTVLAFGGSQGARRINEAVAGAVDAILDAGHQVLHAAGPAQDAIAARPGYVPVPYIDRMDLAYAAADVAVCRAGAITCAELAAVGLPAVYVPLPHGNGEQRFNAEPTVRAGGGLLVDDADLTPERLTTAVLPLLAEPGRLDAMAKAAAAHGRPDADDALVAMIRDAVGQGGAR